MNDQARQQLAALYAKQGHRITVDAQTCEGLLRDVCGDSKREIAVLVGAVKCGVPTQLAANLNSMPANVLRQRLIATMENQGGFEPNAAGWAIDCWRSVLEGATPAPPAIPVVRPQEEQRQKQQPNPAPPKRAAGARVTLPPAAPVVAAYRDKKAYRSAEVKQAQEYARQEFAAGKSINALRDEMIQQGYPQTIAEVIMWTGSLAQKRGKLMDEGFVAFGIALVVIISSLWIGVKFQIPVVLGGWTTVFLIGFGCIRLMSAFNIPNFSASYRQVTVGKEAL
jgi:hypothetical protein